MIDREKVIKGLECCKEACATGGCPYWNGSITDGSCMLKLHADALFLLKEQEAIKPIYNDEKYGDHLPHCGNCEKVLPNPALYGKVNFCHYCGRKVKWND